MGCVIVKNEIRLAEINQEKDPEPEPESGSGTVQ